jgi:RNA polymerase sigma factor (sigma-70 family)
MPRTIAKDLIESRLDAMEIAESDREAARRKLLAEAEANLNSCNALGWQAARKISRAIGMSTDDARSIVLECLWRAALNFEPHRKIKYITYASFYLKLAFNHAVREHYGRNSEREHRHKTVSIDSVDYKGEKYDQLEPIATEPLSLWSDADWRKFLQPLQEKEAEIVELRYRDDWTLQAIADEYAVTRERIRQILFKSLAKLKRRHETHKHTFI